MNWEQEKYIKENFETLERKGVILTLDNVINEMKPEYKDFKQALHKVLEIYSIEELREDLELNNNESLEEIITLWKNEEIEEQDYLYIELENVIIDRDYELLDSEYFNVVDTYFISNKNLKELSND